MDVRLIHVSAIPLAVVRRRARLSELATVVPHGCGLVWNALRTSEVAAGRHVALYLNTHIDLQVGVEVDGVFEAQGEVVGSHTPAGAAATAIHLGPYQGLGATHDAIRAWCAGEGHRLAGPRWEIYGHWQADWDAVPSRIRTDVFYQLAPTDDATD